MIIWKGFSAAANAEILITSQMEGLDSFNEWLKITSKHLWLYISWLLEEVYTVLVPLVVCMVIIMGGQ